MNKANKTKKKRFLSASSLRKKTSNVDMFRLLRRAEELDDSTLRKVGFSLDIENERIVPNVIGSITDFNINGKWVIDKKAPKEVRVACYYSPHRDWQGNMHESMKFREMLAYKRNFIFGDDVHVNLVSINGVRYVASDLIDSSISDAGLINIANVFLECFGEFIISDENHDFQDEIYKELPFELIPSGEKPWEDKGLHASLFPRKSKSDIKAGFTRIELISSIIKNETNEDPVRYRGKDVLNGYIVLAIPNSDISIFESLSVDNATYVFKGDFMQVGQLTKKEIINQGLHHKRIIHSKQWHSDLTKIIRSECRVTDIQAI